MKKSTVLTLRSDGNKPLRGAYSKPLRRGVLGDIDGRSREGRYLKTIESDLIQQVGGAPSVGQQLLIRRIARAMLMLEILDLKLANPDNWNQCDAATQGGLNNNVRLCLREFRDQSRARQESRFGRILGEQKVKPSQLKRRNKRRDDRAGPQRPVTPDRMCSIGPLGLNRSSARRRSGRLGGSRRWRLSRLARRRHHEPQARKGSRCSS